jgi:hypothetical protein
VYVKEYGSRVNLCKSIDDDDDSINLIRQLNSRFVELIVNLSKCHVIKCVNDMHHRLILAEVNILVLLFE